MRCATADQGALWEVGASWNDGAARIAVRDNGPGVDAADRARLSERFFRVLGSRQNGNGLGLSIVKRIVELHGATLSFAMGLDQCGLAVVIDFPLAGTNAGKRQAHASA